MKGVDFLGRPRKLTDNVKGNITNAEKEERLKSEEQLENFTPISLTPPDWMDDIAKEEYQRIVPLLKELPIAAVDLGLVTSYCISYSDLVRASEALKEEEDIIKTANGTKMNQYHTIRRNAMDKINSIAPKLGMTIDSRLKIVVPKKEEKNDPFKELMNSD